MSNLNEKLMALVEKQRDERGDYFYKGSADPELTAAIEALKVSRDALVGIANAIRLGASYEMSSWKNLADACQITARQALDELDNIYVE